MKKKFSFTLLIVLITMFMVPASVFADPMEWSIYGYVRASDTQKPLAGVTVRIIKGSTGKEVYKSVTKSDGYYQYDFDEKAMASEIQYGVTPLDYKATYIVKVTAVGYKPASGELKLGFNSDGYEKNFKLTKSDLKKPKITTSNITKNSAKISWAKISGASGYVLQRANISGDGKVGSYATIANVKKSITYTDKALKSGKQYSYRVIAYKTVQGENEYSKYSTSVKIKTK